MSNEQMINMPLHLTEQQRGDLLRFNETTEDGQGYDVPKEQMKSLAKVGLVHPVGFFRYELTDIGSIVVEVLRALSEPVPPCDAWAAVGSYDYNEAKERALFEAWATDNGAWPHNVEKNNGSYAMQKAHTDWMAWCACAQSRAKVVLGAPIAAIDSTYHKEKERKLFETWYAKQPGTTYAISQYWADGNYHDKAQEKWSAWKACAQSRYNAMTGENDEQ